MLLQGEELLGSNGHFDVLASVMIIFQVFAILLLSGGYGNTSGVWRAEVLSVVEVECGIRVKLMPGVFPCSERSI